MYIYQHHSICHLLIQVLDLNSRSSLCQWTVPFYVLSLKLNIILILTGDLDAVASFASLCYFYINYRNICSPISVSVVSCFIFNLMNYRNFLLLYTSDYSDILCQQPLDFTPLCELQTITLNGIWQLCKALPENLK